MFQRLVLSTLAALLIIGVSFSGWAIPQIPIQVAFGQDKPPYVLQSEHAGLELDIVRAVLEPEGYLIEPVYLPYRQLHQALSIFPGLSAAAGVGITRDEIGYYVPDFVYFMNYAISLRHHNLQILSIDDLIPHRIIAWQGASYPNTPLGDAFHQQFYPLLNSASGQYFEIANQAQQNEMFWAGRAEVIIVDELIFAWYRAALAERYQTDLEVDIHTLWSEQHFTEISFRDPVLAEQFEKGLEALKNSGEYEAIYQRYRLYD